MSRDSPKPYEISAGSKQTILAELLIDRGYVAGRAEAKMGGGQCLTFAVQKWPRPPNLHGAIGLWWVGGHVSGKKMAVTGHCQKKLQAIQGFLQLALFAKRIAIS